VGIVFKPITATAMVTTATIRPVALRVKEIFTTHSSPDLRSRGSNRGDYPQGQIDGQQYRIIKVSQSAKSAAIAPAPAEAPGQT
jgi:hypothetical protein